jgi:hypothetical protein
MNEDDNNSKDALYGRIMAGKLQFAPAPLFDPTGDCVTYFHENVAYNGVWIDPFVTLFYERVSGRLVGFKVKCVKAIVDAITKERGTPPAIVTFGDVVLHAGKLSRDAAKEKDRQRAATSNLASVEMPEDSYR